MILFLCDKHSSPAMSPSTGKKRKRIEETTRTSSYDGSALSDLGLPTNAVSSASFRDSIRRFLKESAETTSVAGFPTWRSDLVSDANSVLFSLYIVEEDVRKSDRPLCDNCRCVGWSHHFVSKRRYHLIIPREGEWTQPELSNAALDLKTHLLHGMIHCNGFGHLLCIDRKGNNTQTEEIMNLWNRICSLLHVRKITVLDLEKKGNMELRLLHALTYGRSWFAKWGYNFHGGSFGVTRDKYERALQLFTSLELHTIGQEDSTLQSIITTFREAAATANSETSSFVTISDLLQFILALRNSIPDNKKNTKPKKGSSDHHNVVAVSSLLNSRYPERRVEHAVKVIATTLKNHKDESMSRQELRDAVRLYIGDTGLIDFIIKNINDVAVGNLIIRRRLKPKTKTLEFSVQQREVELPDRSSRNPTLEQVKLASLDDAVKSIYDAVVGFGSSESHPVRLATKVLMNSKQFIKNWEFRNLQKEDKENVNHMMCKLMPSYEELLKKLTRPLPPPEVVVCPQSPDLTAEELKLMVQTTLRDTYLLTDQFVVQEVIFLDEEVVVKGSGLDFQTKLRYEGGFEDCIVDCVGCGARDNDGERMVECDECGVWHHTLCSTIDDDEDVPPMFICGRCNNLKALTNPVCR